MNDHDIQLLTLGVTIGILLMLACQIAFDLVDNRRDRKVARAAKAQLAATEGKPSA